MANDLTGNFDAVVEFALPGVNRMLAAMHSSERFLHSISLRVDDNQRPGNLFPRPSVGGATDAFGAAVVNQRQIATSGLTRSQLTAANPVLLLTDPIVNVGLANNAGFEIPPVVPSRFQGLAQLQLSPPAVEVPDASGTLLKVGFQVRSRYFPDPNTSPGTEFMRAGLVITAPVSLFSSTAARTVEVDITSNQVVIAVNPVWTSTPLSEDDVAGINLLIKNAIRTGFQKSSQPLPAKFTDFKLKMLLGGQSAAAMLVNLQPLSGGSGTPPGDPGTVGNIFLNVGDDFAFAVGADFISGQLASQFSLQPPSGTFLSYSLSLKAPTIAFQTGKIVLSINGHAHSSHLPDFDFTFTQAFTLQLVSSAPGGPLDTAALVVVGDINPDVHLPWPFGWIADEFIGSMLGPLRTQRDAEVFAQQPTIMDMFNVNKNLGTFLNQLLNPAQTGVTQEPPVQAQVAYTSVEIRASGIVLHGSLSVPGWPAPHVEFQEIPQNTGKYGVVGPGITTRGPDYSALNTWIPGGAIQQFEWSTQGAAQPFSIDQNKFVYEQPPPENEVAFSAAPSASQVVLPPGLANGILQGYTPVCLTVRGTRISNSGPGVYQAVSGTQCSIGLFPVTVATVQGFVSARPMIAVTQPGLHGVVQVVGHTLAQSAQPGAPSPNVLVHYADNASSGKLDFLTQAVAQSGRRDAITAVVAVLTADQMSKASHVQGITYGEEQGGEWERAYGVKSTNRPLTLLAGPKGNVVWQQEGALDAAKLAAALRKNLTPGGNLSVNVQRLGLRMGVRSPDFLFEYAPGRQMNLRKLFDRQVTVVFWRSTSRPSIDAVLDLQAASAASGAGPVVLAINDGETPDVANAAAVANGFTAVVVPDPGRAIARAYGVAVWPTVVSLDAAGLVRQVRHGRVPGRSSPAGKGSAAGR